MVWKNVNDQCRDMHLCTQNALTHIVMHFFTIHLLLANYTFSFFLFSSLWQVGTLCSFHFSFHFGLWPSFLFSFFFSCSKLLKQFYITQLNQMQIVWHKCTSIHWSRVEEKNSEWPKVVNTDINSWRIHTYPPQNAN